MGRKEGGSLFHQMINVPDVFTYSHRTDKDGNAMAVSDQTRKDYQNWLHKSADYFKGLGIRRLSDIDKEKIQAYADYLKANGKTASTIHSYLTPLCKATGVELAEIEKPIRHASEFSRSSGIGKADGGRPAELNAMIGLREDELRQLRGSDIKERNGNTSVIVRRGKGGKYQEQKVLPEDAAAVRKFFDGSEHKVFRMNEFVSGFDYHGQRREHAYKMLVYYTERLKTEPGYRKKLYKELADQWHRNNKKHRDKLEPLSYFDKPYILRGKNRELAIAQGKPVVLDRLALRAVSILHLAHWRDKVTVQSYYFSR